MSRGAGIDGPALARGVLAGERRALARAITLVESTRADHRVAARELLEHLAPHAGGSFRVGISGAPGVGKSTFIEALGRRAIEAGRRVAVLAVDPSSRLSGGAVLGDKTRMPELARDPAAFIRPSPAGDSLGGVARRTRESVLVCECAGYDLVLVETVGVGQSEVAVAGMTDLLALLLLPGAGDALQGIKRGIVELADLLVVNKADGEQRPGAERAVTEYANALSLLRPRTPGWQVPVLACSSVEGAGLEEVWETLERFRSKQQESGRLAARRAEQARDWLGTELREGLAAALRADARLRGLLPELEAAVEAGDLPPTVAAERALEAFLGRRSGGEHGAVTDTAGRKPGSPARGKPSRGAQR